MLWNKFIVFIILSSITGWISAAQLACPAHVIDAGNLHVLNDATLYNGQPVEMADLIPVRSGDIYYWSIDGVDPYLVCQYKGTTKIITIHAKHAHICAAGKKPFQAYCK